MNQKNNLAIILAAGKGSRMKTSIPKPLNKVYGKPILGWIINSFKKCNIDITVIINQKCKSHFKIYENDISFIFQNNPLGTGHAVMQAKDLIKNYKNIFVFVGDSPFIDQSIIKKMFKLHYKKKCDCTILSSNFKKKFPYARIIKENNQIKKVVEEKNATKKELLIKELFASHYLFNSKILTKYINEIKPNPISGEIYLTDILNILIKENKEINVIKINNWKKLVGLNTKEDIKWIESQKII